MRKKGLLMVLFLLILNPVWGADEAAPAADVDDTNFRYQTKMTKEGLHFRVPEDMPIEHRGGLQVPLPFDEYMYGKFKQLDGVLKGIETRLDRIEKLLLEMKEAQAEKKLQIGES